MNNLSFWTLCVFTIVFFERLIYTFLLRESKGRILDKFIACSTIGSYLLIIFVGLFDFIIRKQTSEIVIIIGIVIISSGIILRRVAISTLGNNWSIYTRDIEDQHFVKTGIYKYLRHPYYLAVSLELLGVIILFQSISAMFLFLILHIPLLLKRISIENKFHKQKFVNYHI